MRHSDRPEIGYLLFGLAVLGCDIFYVSRSATPDRWIVLGMAVVGAGVISRTFMADLVQIARARFGSGTSANGK